MQEQLDRIERKLQSIEGIQTAMNTKINEIDGAINSYTQALKIYKGVSGRNGALQLDLTPLHKSRRDIGAVFLSAAACTGNNIYDWDNKINMALSLSDISTILNIFRAPPNPGEESESLFHDKFKGSDREGQVVTKLTIKRGETGGWRWGLGRRENGEWRYVNVPVSDGETIEIRTLLERAVIRILGW